ncbi:Transposase IS66 family protein, partial [Novosphingobium sp. B1]
MPEVAAEKEQERKFKIDPIFVVLHADDTTVPLLAKLKTSVARIWGYVRDDRPFGGTAPPVALSYYSSDRGGEHPRAHLAGYTGILQVDRYAGFNALFEDGRSD